MKSIKRAGANRPPEAASLRLAALILVALLTLPFVGSITLAAPHAPRAPALSEDALAALPDGDLLLLLAKHQGLAAKHAPRVVVPAGETLATLVTKLGARAGAPVAPEDAAKFLAVDARVAVPVATLLVAADQAWDLRDQAFAKLSPDKLARLHELVEARAYDSPEFRALDAQVDYAALVNAAILLLDTTEGVVMPALQSAIDAGAWPPVAVADPVGVLRLGSPGDDVETIDRIVQIDPAGNDRYSNNAGGTTVTLTTSVPKTPVAVSLDFGGDDWYETRRLSPSIGAGDLGIGLLLDTQGNDYHFCWTLCSGAGQLGVGFARDYSGEDYFQSNLKGLGAGITGYGVLREDSGSDEFHATANAGGSGESMGSIGLMWDRAGSDAHVLDSTAQGLFGESYSGGDGWFVDDGDNADTYLQMNGNPLPHTCNNCEWTFGQPSAVDGKVHGIGEENYGGLASVLDKVRPRPDLGPS